MTNPPIHSIADRQLEPQAGPLRLALRCIASHSTDPVTKKYAHDVLAANSPTAPTVRPEQQRADSGVIARNLLAACDNMTRLEKLPLNHLFHQVLSCDAGDKQCVIELMNRLWPKWQNEPDAVFELGAPAKSPTSHPLPESVREAVERLKTDVHVCETTKGAVHYYEDKLRLAADLRSLLDWVEGRR